MHLPSRCAGIFTRCIGVGPHRFFGRAESIFPLTQGHLESAAMTVAAQRTAPRRPPKCASSCPLSDSKFYTCHLPKRVGVRNGSASPFQFSFLCVTALPKYCKRVFRVKLNARTSDALNCRGKGFRRRAKYRKTLRLPVAFHPELPSLSL